MAIHNWAESLYGIEHPKDLNQWYRALDFLIERKETVEKDLFESQKDLFNSEIDIVLMDTTSLVYFGDGDKAEGILNYGYSKEKRLSPGL